MALFNEITKEFTCECGCGSVIPSWNSFRMGHQPRVWSEDSRARMGRRMSDYWSFRPKSREHVENQRRSQLEFWSSEEGLEVAEARACRGESNYRWRGGFGSVPYGVGWSSYRLVILERDNYTCQGCGTREGLCVHHIDGDPDNWDDRNLITVCHGCNNRAASKYEREYWYQYYVGRIDEIYGEVPVGEAG